MSDPTVPPGPPPSSPPPPPPSGPPGAGAGAPPPPPSSPGGGGYGAAPPPPSPPPPGGGAESPNRGIMIVLSYLGLLALIPLLVEKEDREVQWHAKHGLVLFVAEMIVFTLLWIPTIVLDIGCLGCATTGAYSLLTLAVLILHVVAIVKGINGQRLIVPGITPFVDRF
jgi:uncharacterized membrane protein